MTWEIRKASTEDLPAVVDLLRQASLPLAGVPDHISSFFVAASEGRLVGAIGLEPYGETALLRSAVVDPAWRNSGVGTALHDHLEVAAREGGARRLILLTTTAQRYFLRKGYAVVSRGEIAGPVTRSTEFTGACPDTAVAMQKSI